MPDPTQGLIHLDVAVTDKDGNPVTGLGKQDFALQDNGQPSTIVSFRAVDATRPSPEPPVALILVIDELNRNVQGGGSYDSGQLSAVEEEAEKFLRQNQGQLDQPVSIYRVTADKLSASAQRSQNGNALADEIAHRREPRVISQALGLFGPSANRKSIDFDVIHSLEALGSIAIEERRIPGRKVLFWLGPGWQIDGPATTGLLDQCSELSTRLREARIELWGVTKWPRYDAQGNAHLSSDFVDPQYLKGLTTDATDFGYLALPALTVQTGGGFITTSYGLFNLIGKRAARARLYYSLTFDPPRTDHVDEYHHVTIAVSKPDLIAHSDTGYFDQPVFYDQPSTNVERVTVEQLKHALTLARGTPDTALTQRLLHMELTERLSTPRLIAALSNVRGKKAREALTALADQSVFLEPPASEIASTAAPDAATQRALVALAVDYVNKTFPHLPDFSANRTVVQYHGAPARPGQTWKTSTGDPSLYAGETFKATVRFRQGKELIDEKERTVVWGKPQKAASLETIGTFGPVLGIVLLGATATHGDLIWSHWEEGSNGPMAIFRYRATQAKPLFRSGSEFLTTDYSVASFAKTVAFHGEFAVDPTTGAILRLTMQADLEPRLPLDRSGIMVEYGRQVFDGNAYFCPVKSVSISRQRRISNMHEWSEDFKVYAPFETLLNDMAFGNYHLYRSTARMLPGFTPAAAER